MKDSTDPSPAETALALAQKRIAELEDQLKAKSESENEREQDDDVLSKANLMALLENTSDYIVISDAENSPRFFNHGYAAIMKELLGIDMKPGVRPNLQLQSAEQRAFWEDCHRRIRAGEQFRAEFPLERPNHEPRYFEISCNPLIVDGKVIGSSEVTREVTAKKKQERMLRDSERYNRMLVQRLPIGILLYRMDGKKVDANAAYANIIGRTIEETLELEYEELTPKAYAKEELEKLRALEETGFHGPYEKHYLHKDGHWVPVRLNSLLLEQNGVRYIWSTVEDISERKKAEKRARDLEAELRLHQRLEAVGILVDGIAHEFNNILAPILGYASMLRDAKSSPKLHEKGILRIERAAQRGRDLVSRLLTFSRQGTSALSNLDFSNLVEEALQLMRATLPATIDIQYKNDAAEKSACIVRGNETDLHQVLVNLLTNSAQATPKHGGTIHVELCLGHAPMKVESKHPALAGKPLVILRVKDHGHGMDKATVEHAFEPFFTTKAIGEGTGLGLSIVHGIVSGSAGAIEISSDLEQGSTVTIYLPQISGELPTSDVVPPPELATHHERVLLVDDEIDVARMAQAVLEVSGYRVTVETGSQAALQRLRRGSDRFDLVITDQTMPDMTGIELAEGLRSLGSSTPVLLISGYGDRVSAEKKTTLGITAMLQKPFTATELLQATGRSLGKPSVE
jgi:PAS domain S-box-containing protein